MKKKKRTRKQILCQAYERDLKKISASRQYYNKKIGNIPIIKELCNGVLWLSELSLRIDLKRKLEKNKTA